MPLTVRHGVDQGDLALSFAHLTRDDHACAIIVFDSQQRVVSSSPNAAALLGFTTENILGLSAASLPARVRELLERTTSSGDSSSGTEFLERPDQRTQSLRLTALPLQTGTSTLTAVLIQDLSLAQNFQADIRQLDRLASVGTLATEMAHEVKNALVAVKTFVDLLLEKNPGNELEETVRREMKRIDSIVAQVLKFSRNSAPTLAPTSLHTVLDRTLKMTRAHFEGRNITIVTRLAAAPDTVHGDENHLEQAFLNLLLNAGDAMSGDGTLSIETDVIADHNHGQGQSQSVSRRQLRIIIRDTGCGIPAESMTHLFEPFYTTKTNGTGLGLAITRRIIHEHHGLISAESEPGKGAAFHILLPTA